MKDSFSLRFLYRTLPGRFLLKLLTRPELSAAAGKFLSSSLSACLIPAFIKIYGIDQDEYEGRPYRSLNDFFTRKRPPAGRRQNDSQEQDPVVRLDNSQEQDPGNRQNDDQKYDPVIRQDDSQEQDPGNRQDDGQKHDPVIRQDDSQEQDPGNRQDDGQLVSPCDGYLSIYSIDGESSYRIKHTDYTLRALLRSKGAADLFKGGLLLVFRLTPRNYHRYSYACSGRRMLHRRIPGILHCVRPVALVSVPVFIENTREYDLIDSLDYGKILQMEVGALLIGKIHNHEGGPAVSQGTEKGYFEFGGSTIIVSVQKDRLILSDKLYHEINKEGETAVRMGDCLGQLRPDPAAAITL